MRTLGIAGVAFTAIAAAVGQVVDPGLPSASQVYDFSTGLPGGVTYSRTGSRTAVVNGVVTLLTANSPAIESWGGQPRGLHLQPAGNNMLLWSEDATNAVWAKTGVTVTKDTVGPDGAANSACTVTSQAVTGVRDYRQDNAGAGIAAGTTVTASYFLFSPPNQRGMGLRISNRFDDKGAQVICHPGNGGAMRRNPVDGADTSFTYVEHGREYLGNGWSRVWVTATATGATANRRVGPRFYDFLTSYSHISSAPVYSHKVAGVQFETGFRKSYLPTTTAVASCGADVATIATSGISGFNAGVGTFFIEHDLPAGVLMSLGGSALVSASAGGKVAFAWDGTGSRLVSNGGAATTGATTSVSGTITLGDALRACHIKSISYYDQALTNEQMQTLTAPAVAVSNTAGAWRVSGRCVWNGDDTETIGAGLDTVDCVIPIDIQGARSAIKLIYTNSGTASSVSPADIVGNSAVACTIYVEYNGVSQPLLYSGAQLTMLANSATVHFSDPLLATSFGVSEFADGTQIKVRQRQRYSVINGKQISGLKRNGVPGLVGGLPIVAYNSSTTTGSPVNSTGQFTYTGTPVVASLQRVNAPILIGKYVSGDAPTILLMGDSLSEMRDAGAFVYKAAKANGIPMVEVSKGGQQHNSFFKSQGWRQLWPYVRGVVDTLGSNADFIYDMAQIHSDLKAAGIEYIFRTSLLPLTTSSTDLWKTEAGQTLQVGPYPRNLLETYCSLGQFPQVDRYYKIGGAARGANPDKWATNGTERWLTTDGGHMTPVGDDLVAADLTPVIATIPWKQVS